MKSNKRGEVRKARQDRCKSNPRPRGLKWPNNTWGFRTTRTGRRRGRKT